MRNVADSLSVGSMALYRYVDTKEQLHVVLLDHAYGPPSFDYPASSNWRERIDIWTRAVVARLLDHLWMVGVPLYTPPLTPNTLAWTEKGHVALSASPLDAAQRYSILAVLDGWCKEQVRTGTQLGYLGSTRPDTTAEYLRQLFDVLDPDQHPLLHAANLELAQTPPPPGGFFSSQFEFGLGVLLDGIEQLINCEMPK
jgi:AcrR family transcriptional regulator